MQDLEEDLPKMKIEVAAAKADIDGLKCSGKKVQDSTKDIQNNAAASVFEEMRERENRRLNIVIHNLSEPPVSLTTGKERIANDKEKIHSLCNQIGVDVDAASDIRFVKRLGQRPENPAAPRPLLLGIKNVKIQEKILECAPKLADQEEPWASVNIVQDLTKMQRG